MNKSQISYRIIAIIISLVMVFMVNGIDFSYAQSLNEKVDLKTESVEEIISEENESVVETILEENESKVETVSVETEVTESTEESESTEELEVSNVPDVINDDPEARLNRSDANAIENFSLWQRSMPREIKAVGIDVSVHQGKIDWQKVKDAGVQFAIIRVGYRGYAQGTLVEDTYAKANLEGAKKVGIKIGAYFFSTALTEDEAREEARFTANILKDYPVTYPVVYDCEGYYDEDYRTFGLSKTVRTNNAIAFLDEIKKLGYIPMMYASKNGYSNNNEWETSKLEQMYDMWVAQYFYYTYDEETGAYTLYPNYEECIKNNKMTNYTGEYTMWQFSSQGKIPGIDNYADLDFDYIGYDIENEKTQSTDIVVTNEGNKLKIVLENVTASYSVTQCLVPVWSEKNGQDDIVWYQAEKNGKQWVTYVDLANHKYDSGKYHIHAYFKDIRGTSRYAGAGAHDVVYGQNEFKCLEGTKTNGDYTLILSNLLVPYSIERVVIPTWTIKNGQDDIHWYEAEKQGNQWSVNVKVKDNHNSESDDYCSHAYGVDSKGNYHFIAAINTNVFIEKSELTNVIAIEKTSTQGDFSVSISNVENEESYKMIYMPVWSEKNGQDDLVWYPATKEENSWKVNVNIKNHNYESGMYNIHIYGADNDGNMILIKAMTEEIAAKRPENYVDITIKNKNYYGGDFTIQLDNLYTKEDIKEIYVPVWTEENGQDDIVWYIAKQGHGEWIVPVSPSNHNGETGVYQIHVYYLDTKGNMHFLNNSVYQVENYEENKEAKGSLSVIKKTDNIFTIQIDNIEDEDKIQNIYVPVWTTNNGQDDIIWYIANKVGNRWIVNVSIANHNLEKGVYAMHLYYQDKSGNLILANFTDTVVE